MLRYKDRVHHWEIWNEPNYWRFWLPQPDVGAYTTLLKQAYAAIKAVDPAATVMVGGLTVGSGENLPSTFLQNLYDANGGTSNGLFDGSRGIRTAGARTRRDRPRVGAPGRR